LLAYSPVRGAFSERTGQFQATTHAERAKSLPHFVLEIGASLVQYRHRRNAESLMANKFGIPEEVEQRIRIRDKLCVYCHKRMIYPCVGDKQRDWATIEHFREVGPFYWWDGLREEGLGICCGSCNSSRGRKKLKDWFKTPYCVENKINEKTVAKPVKEYTRRLENPRKGG
ncbi:MAG: hypothetical protein Q7S95_04235, partial [bacterium]|nr:hypothetical protein [bacterium]